MPSRAASLPLRILITGSTGMVGQAALAALAARGHIPIIAVRPVGPRPASHLLEYVAIDYSSPGALAKSIDACRCQRILHIAAVSQPDRSHNPDAETLLINAIAPHHLALAGAQTRTPIIFTSTDCVFDGKQGRYTEQALPNPVNRYGQFKLVAEYHFSQPTPDAAQQELIPSDSATASTASAVASVTACPHAFGNIVARVPLVIGSSAQGDRSGTERIVLQAIAGKPITAYNDEYRTPIDVGDLARRLVQLCERELGTTPCIVHLPGAERLSRADIARRALAAAGLPDTVIAVATPRADPSAMQRPRDVSLATLFADLWSE